MSAAPIAKLEVKPPGNAPFKRPSRSGPSSRSLNSTVLNRGKQYMVGKRARKRIMIWHIFTIIRRLVVIAAAVQYIFVSMTATARTVQSLTGAHNPQESFRIFTTTLIAGYAGKGRIRDSPLVYNVLKNDTTPRDYAVFLESKNKTSFTNCSAVPKFNPAIYNYDFLSRSYRDMVVDTKHNFTALAELELVLVVIDCTFTQLKAGDRAMVRVFTLVRSFNDPNDLYLVAMSMNVQDYEIPNHNKVGPGLLGMLNVVQDMKKGTVGQYYLYAPTYPYQRSMEFEAYELVGVSVDSYLELRSIPQDPETQPVKHLFTARKRGFFDGEDQSNIRYMYSLLNGANATTALSAWEWLGEAVIKDSWAWVHGIHFFFAIQTIFSLVVLSLVAFHNIRAGKVWIGDPFASVSSRSLVTRGILVWISWYIDSYWTPFEYSMMNGGLISKTQIVRVHGELVHADILVLYLSLVGLLSTVFRERIDPSVAIFLFEIINKHFLSIVSSTTSIRKQVVASSDSVFYLGVARIASVIAAMTPMRLWTTFQIPARKSKVFLAASFFPIIVVLAIIAGFAIVRKIYRHFFPEPMRTRSSLVSTDRSMNENAAVTMKGNLTNFEISTGAELQTRFGLISDYNNYVYFKGMKFASADGVYCSGYVIVNGKFLVSSKDLLAIMLMKAIHSRFTNVYVYEVEGNTVKDTARLAYPHTFMWSDLWHLNVTVLL